VDFLSHTVKPKGQPQKNQRAVVISNYFESHYRPKFHPEYKESMDHFPNLFNKQKSEFIKFANVNDTTQRIIKSYFAQGIPRNVTSAGNSFGR
jgi:predicted metallo-beta-lactamase superfamily hydrolase